MDSEEKNTREPTSRPSSGSSWLQVNCLVSLVLSFFVPRMVLEQMVSQHT